MSSVSNSQDVSIDLDSLPPRDRGGGYLSSVHRQHSRSASWSLPGGQSTIPVGRGLVSLNPMTPITNVIREIVPSFGRTSESNNSNGGGTPHASRNPSQTSLLLGTPELESNPVQGPGETQDTHDLSSGHDTLRTLGDSSSNVNVNLPREHTAIGLPRAVLQGAPEEQNVGLELSDTMQWLEHNAIFIILLLIKLAWYHRSG